ncbi:rCG49068 [Rattus norvegicus]|uniref:RCG49068 n=1 Tax=Rattus norvegicus TaxID=10116 RepID=A6IGZ9_RAT|nr:rCG49068 [Rattus norvegicus]
MHCNFRFRR